MNEQHYFSENPEGRTRRTEFAIEVAGRQLTLEADAGVFSQRGLDKGTAVLLEAMKKTPLSPPEGSVLCDVGCGSGPIALALAISFPTCTVLAVDINERARKLCTENARRNGITNIKVVAPDDVDPETRIELLWSNPPIRIGKTALHDLLLTWLSRLTSTGTAHLVVNKNLGADSLAQWLSAQGFPNKKLGSSKGFRVLEVTRGT